MDLPEVDDMTPEQRRELIGKMAIINRKHVRQCEHIKTNGEFCGSPAMRGRNYCYFHLTYIGRRIRAERVSEQLRASAADATVAPLELPPLEDANAIQMSLMQVIDAILHNRLDTKRAGLVLYALQTASSNLARADFEPARGATVAGEYATFEEDFDLGDTAPELSADEEEQDQEEIDEREAKIVQIEQLADAYAKLDRDQQEAYAQLGSDNVDAAVTRSRERGPDSPFNNIPDEELWRPSYPCGHMSQFFCSLNGPLQRAKACAPEGPRQMERQVASQKLEIRPAGRRAREKAA